MTNIFGGQMNLGASEFAFVDAEERRLQLLVDQRAEQARLKAEQAATAEAAIRATDKLTAMRDAALPKSGQLQKALQEYQQIADALAKAGSPISAGQQATDKANIVEKIFGKTSTVQAQLSEIERTVAASVQRIEQSDAELDQKRAARQIKDDEYYRQRIANIQAETATRIAALNAENAIIQQEQALGQKRIDNQNKIAENLAQIAMLQADAAAQTKLLGDQQVIEADRITRALDQARASAQAYLDTLGRAYQRDLDDMGQGPAARRYSSGRNQIDDSFLSQRQGLSSQLTAQQITPEQYDAQLGILNDYHQRAISQWDLYYAQLEQKGTDFATGFNDVVLSYLDSTRNVGATLANDMIGAIEGATSATANLAARWVIFGEGGKQAVAQIAASLATELLSSLIKVGIQMGLNAVLGQTLGAAAVAASGVQAAAASAVWLPAAIAASTATLGGAAAIGASSYTAALASGAAANTASMAAGAGGFKEGGYTGSGGVNEVAGPVHRREFVVNADATAKNRPLLEMMNRGHRPIDSWGGSGGAAPVQAAAPSQRSGTKIVNAWDKDDFRGDLLDSDDTDEIIINRMSRKSARYRSALGLES